MDAAPLPPPPPLLPVFSALPEEEQPQRGTDDYDPLSTWARAVSNSPRLFPYGVSSGAGAASAFGLEGHSTGFGSYKGLGEASPMLEPRRDSSFGVGPSPLLGPTLLRGNGPSAAPTSGLGSMVGGGYDYSYAGGGAYHAHQPPHRSPQILHHGSPTSLPLSMSHSHPGSAHSFSNLERHQSMSPTSLPPPLHPHSPAPVRASPRPRSTMAARATCPA